MKNYNNKIHLISLGCPKNLVDSEYLLGMLTDRNLEITENPEEARAILINTCGFIQSAVEESIEAVLGAAELKQSGKAEALIVFGCMPQRYKDELISTLPEVDLFWGSGRYDELPDRIVGLLNDQGSADVPVHWDKPGFCSDSPGPRLRSAPYYSAYLKITEGCSNVCSYCMIPRLRGPLRSRPLETLLDEAKALSETGVKELILVAQDTTAYGRDLDSDASLAQLLKGLTRIDKLEWIRVMYAYPSGITDELIDVIAAEPNICNYLDIPLQHASPGVLKRMRRDCDIDPFALIRKLRDRIPDIVLRTTMMVGFPGETDDDFDILINFIETARFDRLGAFKFSPEDGVPAARYPDQVQQRIKENRRRRLMAAQRRISRSSNKSFVNKTLPVLVEGVSPETDLLLIGRTRGMAPEIDGSVLITRGVASAGEIRNVLITESHDYDLVGELTE